MSCESVEEDYCSSWSEPDNPGVCRSLEEYQLNCQSMLMGISMPGESSASTPVQCEVVGEDNFASWSIPDEVDAYSPMEEPNVMYTASVEVEANAPEVQTSTEVPPPEAWSPEALGTAQRNDPNVGYVLALVEAGVNRPIWNEISHLPSETKTLISFWPRLAMKDGLLQRQFESVDKKSSHWQVVMPKKLREKFIELIHAGPLSGHFGQKKTMDAVQARAYWPSWAKNITEYLKRCRSCAQYHRGELPRQAELQTPVAGEVWERVSIDITGSHPKSCKGNVYILTIVDHFSKWGEAVAIPNHTAVTVAKVLMSQIFSRYGAPVEILSDRGPEFESELFLQLMKWMEIDKLRTTAYKPSTNGVVERFHRTLNSMLGKVTQENQRDWDERLPFVLAAYRATVHSSTGFTPNKVFLGRENRMPVDVVMGLPPEEVNGSQSIDEFVVRQQELAEDAFQLVRQHLGQNASRRKSTYDTRVRKTEYLVGDWVWYYYPRKFTQKSPKWQRNYTGPYKITRVIEPVNFVLQKIPRSAPFVVHMDKIKKCYTPPAKDWTLGPESGADQPDAAAAPADRSGVQPTQDQAMEVNGEVTPQDVQLVSRPLGGVMPIKKARKEARYRRVLDEVRGEESEVVSSPRARKRPCHLKDFVCRRMEVLSPIYEVPEECENLRESECL